MFDCIVDWYSYKKTNRSIRKNLIKKRRKSSTLELIKKTKIQKNLRPYRVQSNTFCPFFFFFFNFFFFFSGHII